MIGFKVLDRERLTPTSATGFTASLIPPAEVDTEYVVIQVVAGNIINFCIDGTTATTSVGDLLTKYSKLEVWGYHAMKDFSCIDNGAACTVECTFMGRGS